MREFVRRIGALVKKYKPLKVGKVINIEQVMNILFKNGGRESGTCPPAIEAVPLSPEPTIHL